MVIGLSDWTFGGQDLAGFNPQLCGGESERRHFVGRSDPSGGVGEVNIEMSYLVNF